MANSFLTKLEAVGIDIAKGAGTALVAVGPQAAGAAATAVGGPVAGAVAQSLVNSIVQAERNHLATNGNAPAVALPIGLAKMDPRKAAVLQNFEAFMPVIEALASATGHPVAEPARFEAALPLAIDATVQGFNAYAEVIAALHPAT
ncbi:MAG: hypothetical protein JWO19_3914 [Bryobacterales bacterium]|jgi:hypothetical protein|nr:hypothetical protein [Bryobacterales bacterium]